MRARIVWTIFCKEITEALRDRVTLLVLVGLPLVFYPVVFVTTSQVTEHRAMVVDRRVSTVAVWGVGVSPLLDWLAPTNNRLKLELWQGIPASLRRELEAGRLPPGYPPLRPREFRLGLGRPPGNATVEPEDAVLHAAREVVSSKQADAVMIVWPGFDDALRRQERGRVSVYYDSVTSESAQTWSRLSDHLDQFRQHVVQERQRERGLPKGFLTPLEVQPDDIAPFQRQLGNILGQVLPLLLIMLAALGALIAAIDMSAGEKERATMQTLLCAPVRSLEIVGGKFLAVWTVSLVSALANIAGIGFTIGRVAAVFHLEAVQFGTLLAVLALLLPATWTIAALFLGVAVLARDVKDAGNFLSGTLFVMLMPVAASFLPGVELDTWTSCVPLLNLSLLIRALMTGGVATRLIFLTLLSSLAYAGLALALAARAFGREQILLGGPFSWRQLLRGDPNRPATPTPSLVLTLFPVAFASLFYLSLSNEIRPAGHGAGAGIWRAALAGDRARLGAKIPPGPNLLPAPTALAQPARLSLDRPDRFHRGRGVGAAVGAAAGLNAARIAGVAATGRQTGTALGTLVGVSPDPGAVRRDLLPRPDVIGFAAVGPVGVHRCLRAALRPAARLHLSTPADFHPGTDARLCGVAERITLLQPPYSRLEQRPHRHSGLEQRRQRPGPPGNSVEPNIGRARGHGDRVGSAEGAKTPLGPQAA